MDFGLFCLMNQRDPAKPPERILAECVEQVRLADEAGFGVAWFAEHHFSNYCLCPSPLLMAAQRVTVFTAFESGKTEDALTQSHKRLGAWLADHAIHPLFKRAEGTGREAAEHLLSQVSDIGADLVVMGGYAHPRAREYVLGGATRTMLESMTVPVLMSH